MSDCNPLPGLWPRHIDGMIPMTTRLYCKKCSTPYDTFNYITLEILSDAEGLGRYLKSIIKLGLSRLEECPMCEIKGNGNAQSTP